MKSTAGLISGRAILMSIFQPRAQNDEHGYALLSTLICLMVGGLIIAGLLTYTSTMLRARATMEANIGGLYDADAGIEHVLWCLDNGASPNSTLPQSLNGNEVLMQVDNMGELTMYADEWVTLGSHSDWLLVEGSLVYDELVEAYEYTITVTWNAEASETIHISEVGAKLPVGYSYEPDSASLFDDNLSTDEPEIESDIDEGQIVKWILPSPRPTITEDDPVRTETFHISGNGDLSGHYAWAVAARADVGYVSELSGTFYVITSTALLSEGGEIIASIKADVMLTQEDIFIIAWQINPD